MERSSLVNRLCAGVAAATLSLSLFPATAAGAVSGDPPTLAAVGTAPCDGAPAGRFGDVLPGNTHAANIDCVGHLRIARGIGGDRYAPARDVSRAQMATYLVNLLHAAGLVDLDALATVDGAAGFGDISGSTHADNIRIARSLRITSGLTPATYDPAGPVSRAQMASFVAATVTAAGAALPSNPPRAFADHLGSVHTANIDAIAAAGIVRGVGGGRYDPAAPVSRAQMATYLVHTALYLRQQDAWGSPTGDESEVAGPDLVRVSRADTDHMDRVALDWDTEVVLAGSAAGIEVYDADNVQPIGEATSVVAGAGDGASRLVAQLDGDLEPGGRYWMRVAADLATDAEDRGNEALELAFTFELATGGADGDGASGDDAAEGGDGSGDEVDGSGATDDGAGDGTDDGAGDGTDDGSGDGSGDGTDGGTTDDGGGDGAGTEGSDEGSEGTTGASVPSVIGAVTDPDAAVIRVEFSDPVTCPNTVAGRAAWSFANLSVIESGTSQAQGAPQAVAASSDSRMCELRYDVGIENGDFGTLTYTQPSETSDRVTSSTGGHLASVDDVTVRDGIAPSFLSIAATVGPPGAVQVAFSEPIDCATISAATLAVLVDGALVNGAISGTYCSVFSSTATVQVWPATFEVGDSVSVAVVGSILSQSGFTEVPLGAVRMAVAGA